MSDPTRAIRVIALRQPFVAFEARAWRPPLNIYETEQALTLVVDLAGANPAELQIYVNPTLIVVRGTRQLAAPPGLRRIQRMEIGAGPFELEVPLATPVDPERASGRYSDGLLEIAVPYASEPTTHLVVIQIEGGAR